MKSEKMEQNKVLIVTDYLPDAKNSVSEILNVLIERLNNFGKKCVIIQYNNELAKMVVTKEYNFGKVYRGKPFKFISIIQLNGNFFSKILSISSFAMQKILLLFGHEGRFVNKQKHRIIKKIIKKEKPDLVAFLIYTPNIECSKICQDLLIKHVFILYDTYLARPQIDKAKVVETERKLIDKSLGYFIPSFFYDEYKKTYGDFKVYSYNLPLVIEEKTVKDSYKGEHIGFDYLYLGQIQEFRNENRIKSIFEKLHLKLDIFTSQSTQSDEVFTVHSSISGEELYRTIANSRFLVAFDNSSPYNHYLPSKVYLYVSFTKPIIAFGDNENSALIDFFKGYPHFYYQNINCSTEGLMSFINSETINRSFDSVTYKKYIQFSPKYAATDLVKKLLNNC